MVRVGFVEKQDLDGAKASLVSSLSLMKQGPGASANDLSSARRQARAAEAYAASATRTLDQDPLMVVAGRVPLLRDQVGAIRAGAQMGARAADALDRTSSLLADLSAR